MKKYDVEMAIVNSDGVIEMWDADAVPDYIEADSEIEAMEYAKDYLHDCIINNGGNPDAIIELRARKIGIDYLPIEGKDGWVYSD